ncbi:hypothetical protein NDU88_001309 [Pleurodeles waltl]|uniref:Uncharacterized protein n=1 Tax=Pleurodeles waltl TaxID=8319 RepID=A0AAV7RB88_PLEWA|nr:hypothetical protein NDU88_001309 [Pleurodeles waltl]
MIQGSKTELVNRIEAVAIEVNLLCADLRKVLKGLAAVEQNVDALQQEVCGIRPTVSDLQKLTARLDERIEDSGLLPEEQPSLCLVFP